MTGDSAQQEQGEGQATASQRMGPSATSSKITLPMRRRSSMMYDIPTLDPGADNETNTQLQLQQPSRNPNSALLERVVPEDRQDNAPHRQDDLRLVVRKVFLQNAGERGVLSVHELTFLTIIMVDQLGFKDISHKSDWAQVVTALFHQIDAAGRGELNCEQVISLVEGALEYYGVPPPGRVEASAATKASAMALSALAEKHTTGDSRAKVHDFFLRYASLDEAGVPLMSVDELSFLSILLAAELGAETSRLRDWMQVLMKNCRITVASLGADADGLLNEQEVAEIMERSLAHYGIHRPAGRSTPADGTAAITSPQAASGNRLPGSANPAALTTGDARRKKAGTKNALPTKLLSNEYDLDKKLGQGGQGTVYLAKEKGTGYTRVVKFYSKKSAPSPPGEDAKKEFAMLKSLDHPKIQRLYDVFEDHENVYVVGEAYSGGDLTKLVDNATRAGVVVTPLWLLRALRQMLEGVAYLHTQKIEHCDLKEQNVMVARADEWEDPRIIVIDFGLARHFADAFVGVCGTPGYIPPEVWSGEPWSAKGDVHSLGVVLYQLFGAPQRPYPGTTVVEMSKATLEVEPDMSPVAPYPGLEELLSEMFEKYPEHRPTVKDCLESKFFRQDPGRRGRVPLPADVIESMTSAGAQDDIRTAVLADIADRLNFTELRRLGDTFAQIDSNDDGYVEAKELRACLLLDKSVDSSQVDDIVQRLVGDKGQVPYTMFMGQLLASKDAEETELLKKEFAKLDTSGDGSLDKQEIAALMSRPVLSQVLGQRDAAQLMDLMDADHDGLITWEEFRDALRGDKNRTKVAPTQQRLAGRKVARAQAEAMSTVSASASAKVVRRGANGEGVTVGRVKAQLRGSDAAGRTARSGGYPGDSTNSKFRATNAAVGQAYSSHAATLPSQLTPASPASTSLRPTQSGAASSGARPVHLNSGSQNVQNAAQLAMSMPLHTASTASRMPRAPIAAVPRTQSITVAPSVPGARGLQAPGTVASVIPATAVARPASETDHGKCSAATPAAGPRSVFTSHQSIGNPTARDSCGALNMSIPLGTSIPLHAHQSPERTQLGTSLPMSSVRIR
eukprot:TRINITY_DN6304_c1_g1_i4.p1 TRINITY_DN6304_c1_g1~~TRINITY_DN6304_c1_g1_i4.p1  ORF type:complete len:1075 (-),score=189.10 TRINITY_DN6304_c1_g1_i4:27-3251(-)